MTEAKAPKLRAPGWRQEPNKPYRTYEVKGRVICPGCEGKGCDTCNRRGWMIDENAIQEEWNYGP